MAPASRTWIVLGQDGRHVTLGRAAPTDEEIVAASEALAAQGLGGWIAAMGGSYWGRGRVMLAPTRTIGADVTLDWSAAVTVFSSARRESGIRPARTVVRGGTRFRPPHHPTERSAQR
jgi:hypothetical protein